MSRPRAGDSKPMTPKELVQDVPAKLDLPKLVVDRRLKRDGL